MRVDAVYVRKSTSPQEEQSQIDAIRDYLDRTGVGVAPEHWFTDTGSRHRPEDRPDFQKMLALVEQKKVRRVYVWKQDRIVSGVWLWGHIMYTFERASTQLIDILTGKDLAASDIANEITTVVNARGAKEEQVKISNNTLRAKVSLAKEGMPISKFAPYGYDKKYVDAAGRHLWTAHVIVPGRKPGEARYRIVMPDGNRYERAVPPRKSKSDRIVYVPTEEDPERVEAVRYLFKTYAEESITVPKLAVRLNQLGHTLYGRPWLKTTVEDVLRNPAYIGSVRLGKFARGEFTTYDGTQLVPANNPDQKLTRNPVERQIITPDRHEPLVDRATWDLVQEKLTGRRSRPTPPARDDLWLRGVLVCGSCGRPMHTFCQGTATKGYICGSYYRFGQTRSSQHDTGCARNWVPHAEVEKLVAADLEGKAGAVQTGDDGVALNAIVQDYLGVHHELRVAVQNGLHEYMRDLYALFMAADGQAQFRRLLGRYAGLDRPVRDADLLKKIDEVAAEFGIVTVEQARSLFICFEEEKVKLARKKVAEVGAEYERWVLAKAGAENDRERNLARTRCQELEKELVAWEGRLVPLDDQLADLRSKIAAHRNRFGQAADALRGGTNRRKAQIVRELYSEIVLHFRRIEQKKRVVSEFLPDQTEFRTTFMDGSCRRSCRRSRGRAPTGRSRLRDSRRRSRSS
jgi:predicted site-specific integrase-resolvase